MVDDKGEKKPATEAAVIINLFSLVVKTEYCCCCCCISLPGFSDGGSGAQDVDFVCSSRLS